MRSIIYYVLACFLLLVACTSRNLQNGIFEESQEPITQRLAVYLIPTIESATSDVEQICGDTVEPVSRVIETTDGSFPASIHGALEELFSIGEIDLRELDYMSAIAEGVFSVTEVRIENQRANIEIEGPEMFPETACDASLGTQQITMTVEQFRIPGGYTIVLNGSEEAWQALSQE